MPDVIESIRYEAYGPGGAAMLIDCRSADRERTIGTVRSVIRAHGGYPGARGSVSYLFNEVGRLVFPAGTDAGRLAAAAVRAGAEEVDPSGLEVLTDPIELDAIREALREAGFEPATAEVTQRASIRVPLKGEVAVELLQLIGALNDLDDVETVYTNAEIPDEVLASL